MRMLIGPVGLPPASAPIRCRPAAWALLLITAVLPAERAARADRLILRNLEVIADRQVVDFDEDGIRLDNGLQVGWHEVERGQVSPDRQAAFDQLLAELGTQLYRLRQRLGAGDYRGLLEQAQALYPRYVGRDSDTAYLVCQSLMWARLASGQREAAVEPYVRCYDYLRKRTPDEVKLPGPRRLTFDRQTGMAKELPPVWFDAQAAGAALPGVIQAVAQIQEPRPEGMRIYYGTLALAAGDRESARRVLAGVQGQQRELAELLTIALAQSEVLASRVGPALEKLEANLGELAPENRVLALYWLGRSKLAAPDPAQRQAGVLQLLHLPALYGDAYPDLAAAALYDVMAARADPQAAPGQAALGRELLSRYNQTYHAARLRREQAGESVNRNVGKPSTSTSTKNEEPSTSTKNQAPSTKHKEPSTSTKNQES